MTAFPQLGTIDCDIPATGARRNAA